jgi:hypothetical protein
VVVNNYQLQDEDTACDHRVEEAERLGRVAMYWTRMRMDRMDLMWKTHMARYHPELDQTTALSDRSCATWHC